MNKIIRIWNKNRKLVIFGALLIVFVIIAIQLLNQLAKAQKEQDKKNNNTIQESIEKLPTESVITGEKVDTELTKSNVNMIEEFVTKCNNKDISGAYSMLTEECKQTIFKTQESFQKGYYDIIFKENRICDIENYKNLSKLNTYKVKLYSDVLSTGDTDNTTSYQDYITIDQNSKKISINSLIYVKEINKSEEKDGIKITILKQQVYKDYERYEINIENKTNKRILIDTKKGSRSIYVLGSNNISYSAYTSEISSNLYEIPAYFNKTYNIKFDKIYNDITVKSLTFSDIVSDYEKYNKNPEEIKERVRITVNI